MKMIARIILIIPCTLVSAYYAYSYSFKSINKEQVISQIMNYPMIDVIERCKNDFGYTDEDMRILERELKRYFIMIALAKDGGTGMYSKDVDNLWHSFILFTKEYSDFCNTCVGRFLHHVPEINTDKTPEEYVRSRKEFQDFIKNYETIFKEETHSIWFLDMCEDPQKLA